MSGSIVTLFSKIACKPMWFSGAVASLLHVHLY